MTQKFKTLFVLKSSLISLYLALTLPIPFIASEKFKVISIIAFFTGLFLIFYITDDYVETCDKKISLKTSFLSNFLGKKSWDIFWTEIKLIKSFPTSQGSKVYYFVTTKGNNILVPQRVENFKKYLSIISKNTQLSVDDLSYISPLWTYKLLTLISLLMVACELFAFLS